uniref:Uncharacterized protein n=1 Tax=Setaria digitata TaxID=48799 RepID=A0A915PTS3_9BILA
MVRMCVQTQADRAEVVEDNEVKGSCAGLSRERKTEVKHDCFVFVIMGFYCYRYYCLLFEHCNKNVEGKEENDECEWSSTSDANAEKWTGMEWTELEWIRLDGTELKRRFMIAEVRWDDEWKVLRSC